MNNALIDAFVHQVSAGNKLGGTFTSIAYTNITKEMSEKFQRSFDKEKVKDRWKLVKRNFTKCHDIFNGMSGFAWKSDTHMWDVHLFELYNLFDGNLFECILACSEAL